MGIKPKRKSLWDRVFSLKGFLSDSVGSYFKSGIVFNETDLLELAPYLTYLNFSDSKFSDEFIKQLLTKAENVEINIVKL